MNYLKSGKSKGVLLHSANIDIMIIKQIIKYKKKEHKKINNEEKIIQLKIHK